MFTFHLFAFLDYGIGDKLTILKNVFSFTFVRHPFVRLVSTYQDKVIDNNYRHWREIIPKNYTRVPITSRIRNHDWPTFEEFVAFFLINGDNMRRNFHIITYTEKVQC